MRKCCFLLLLALLACAPRQQGAEDISVINDEQVFEALLSPFKSDLAELGVYTISGAEVYSYGGSDPNAFISAINTFYQNYPGFCPLENAFYAAPSGLRFMTLAGDGSMQVRGFLYDQSRKPKLIYAYFEGVTDEVLPVVTCETVGS